MKSALERFQKPSVDKNACDLDFDSEENENIFENKELIFVQEMSKLPSSHLPKGLNWH